jgi:hypothetical protein
VAPRRRAGPAREIPHWRMASHSSPRRQRPGGSPRPHGRGEPGKSAREDVGMATGGLLPPIEVGQGNRHTLGAQVVPSRRLVTGGPPHVPVAARPGGGRSEPFQRSQGGVGLGVALGLEGLSASWNVRSGSASHRQRAAGTATSEDPTRVSLPTHQIPDRRVPLQAILDTPSWSTGGEPLISNQVKPVRPSALRAGDVGWDRSGSSSRACGVEGPARRSRSRTSYFFSGSLVFSFSDGAAFCL